jgi:biotin carboxyl carrier protein
MIKPQFDLKQITAFIPGTIREIVVSVGQQVKEGQDLLILEAMKMRNRVKSPVTGKVKAIYVKENQSVPKNFIIIEN